MYSMHLTICFAKGTFIQILLIEIGQNTVINAQNTERPWKERQNAVSVEFYSIHVLNTRVKGQGSRSCTNIRPFVKLSPKPVFGVHEILRSFNICFYIHIVQEQSKSGDDLLKKERVQLATLTNAKIQQIAEQMQSTNLPT